MDFGQLGLTWDAATRSRKRTWVFSDRLRHSRRAYREVVFDQKQETFVACHMHAFEWFGGVPEKVTPDNLKATVITASFEDPLVNRAYRELALHYGCPDLATLSFRTALPAAGAPARLEETLSRSCGRRSSARIIELHAA